MSRATRLRLGAFAVLGVGIGFAQHVTEGWTEFGAVFVVAVASMTWTLLQARADDEEHLPYRWRCDTCGVRIRSTSPTAAAVFAEQHDRKAHDV